MDNLLDQNEYYTIPPANIRDSSSHHESNYFVVNYENNFSS